VAPLYLPASACFRGFYGGLPADVRRNAVIRADEYIVSAYWIIPGNHWGSPYHGLHSGIFPPHGGLKDSGAFTFDKKRGYFCQRHPFGHRACDSGFPLAL
jgi:hypothetical protein